MMIALVVELKDRGLLFSNYFLLVEVFAKFYASDKIKCVLSSLLKQSTIRVKVDIKPRLEFIDQVL